MGAYQRTKGHNFERWVAKIFRPLFPATKRGYQARDGTKAAPDVDGTPWYIECKVGAHPNIRAAVLQAKAGTDGRPVLVVTRRDHEEPLSTMILSDFMVLLQRLESAENKLVRLEVI